MTPSLRPSFFPPKIFPIVANQPFPAARMGFGELFKSSHGLAVLTISTDGLANARMKAVVFFSGRAMRMRVVCEQQYDGSRRELLGKTGRRTCWDSGWDVLA